MTIRSLFLSCLLVTPGVFVYSQQSDPKSPQETAKTYTREGDYTNAIVVLTAAIQKDPQNMELQKDLAFNYYLQTDYAKGLNIARPLTDRPDADVQCYQLTGMLLKATGDNKECERLYKGGLKKFPRSGVLYNEYGEILGANKDINAAIKQWEKGIEVDPNYSSNYYNACRYYYYSDNDKVWGLLYGEIFLNLESYSKRTAEIKEFLLESYKKFFSGNNANKDQGVKSAFTTAFLTEMDKLSSDVAQGLTPESLIVLRTRFIINWFNNYPTNFPFRLFDYQRQLLKDGMFDAYNEWLFGVTENLPAFQAWTSSHKDEYDRFANFQKGRIFKLPEGQYYQSPK